MLAASHTHTISKSGHDNLILLHEHAYLPGWASTLLIIVILGILLASIAFVARKVIRRAAAQ